MGTLATVTRYLRRVAGYAVETAPLKTSAGAADAEAIPALNDDGVLDHTIINATVTSAGAGDADKITALDASGRLDSSVMPVGIGADTATIQTSEALASGDYINIHDVAGAFRVRKADATTAGKEAHGFVLAAVGSGANAGGGTLQTIKKGDLLLVDESGNVLANASASKVIPKYAKVYIAMGIADGEALFRLGEIGVRLDRRDGAAGILPGH